MADYYIRKRIMYPDLHQEVEKMSSLLKISRSDLASDFISSMNKLGDILDYVIDKETSDSSEDKICPVIKDLLILCAQLKLLDKTEDNDIDMANELFVES